MKPMQYIQNKRSNYYLLDIWFFVKVGEIGKIIQTKTEKNLKRQLIVYPSS